MRKPRGHPTKYSDALAAVICQKLSVGSTRTAAAESSGIHRDTFANWMASRSAFFHAVTRAEAEAEEKFIRTIALAAKGTADVPGDWRAAESWLKRRRRDDWGDSVRAEHSGPGGGPIAIEHRQPDEESIIAAADEIRERQRLLGPLPEEPAVVFEADVPGV